MAERIARQSAPAVRLAFLLALALVGCVRQPPAVEPGLPAPPPQAAADARAYDVDGGESELRLLVYRDGPLASMGHNHVISHHELTGTVWLGTDPRRAVFRLVVPVAGFEVDRPEMRAAEGEDFAGELPPQAIEGTRENMLGERVLDAGAFPEITITSQSINGELPAMTVTANIELRGTLTTLEVPATVEIDGNRVSASGEFSVRQTDLGMEPFSVMLGALAVRDELVVKYRLVATRADGEGG